jgi:FkbM family methyltransferase
MTASPPDTRAFDPWSVPQPATATAADIFHCFRLLLGRPPNPEEWRGHVSRAGEPLDGVVASYVNSLEFARRGLLEARVPEIERVALDGFSIFVAPSDAAVGRHVRADNYERDVTAVFRRLLRPGMGVIDIGANIGYFTMLSASLVGAEGFVLAIEPNPRNARMLEASRRANGFAQIVLSQTAAGRDTGLLVLNTSHSNGTTSAPPDAAERLWDCETVASLRVDALVPPARRIDLIKADVEGAEYNALLGAAGVIARDRPTIISEFSPGLMPGISGISGPDYLRWLGGLGYRLAVIEPDGTQRAAAGPEAVMDAHAARGTDHIDIVATPDP